WQQRRIERANAQERLVATAKLAAVGERNVLENSRQLLTGWAKFPFLFLVDDKRYSEQQCQNLRMLSTNHVNVGFVEPNGNLYCNAAKTNYSGSMSDRYFFQEVMRRQ